MGTSFSSAGKKTVGYSNVEPSVGGVGIGKFFSLLIELLGLDTLVDEESGGLVLPNKDDGAVMVDGSNGVVLGGDVVGALVDLGTEGNEGFNEDGNLDGHEEGAGDAGPHPAEHEAWDFDLC
ncbi:hypothetical protein VNO78_30613 [Psophocarpus tetragonolobus]|uniref:Uncharacterized protein n=1 Tax=Psophocarpus tetragonolobus TaxID=3891 RepID=A0AAN9RWX4_PSOTE